MRPLFRTPKLRPFADRYGCDAGKILGVSGAGLHDPICTAGTSLDRVQDSDLLRSLPGARLPAGRRHSKSGAARGTRTRAWKGADCGSFVEGFCVRVQPHPLSPAPGGQTSWLRKLGHCLNEDRFPIGTVADWRSSARVSGWSTLDTAASASALAPSHGTVYSNPRASSKVRDSSVLRTNQAYPAEAAVNAVSSLSVFGMNT